MKILVPILLVMMIFTANGFLIFSALNKLNTGVAQAAEYSPLDFIYDYDDFAVKVGVSKSNGRYISYQYEFSE